VRLPPGSSPLNGSARGGPSPVRLTYQPPASSTFLSKQTSHQQSASSTFLSSARLHSYTPAHTARKKEAARRGTQPIRISIFASRGESILQNRRARSTWGQMEHAQSCSLIHRLLSNPTPDLASWFVRPNPSTEAHPSPSWGGGLCSFGLSATSQQYFSLRTNHPSATSQQYFSLRTNQPSATSQRYFSLRTNQHQPSDTSQTNRL
jgi:hypothetical protein